MPALASAATSSQPSTTTRLPLPAQIASVAAPVEDDPFADLLPGAQRPAASAAPADDNPFADLMPGAQPAANSSGQANNSAFAKMIKGGKQASPLYDVMRSAGTGLRSGVEGIIGLPGDIEQAGGYGVRWLADQATQAMGGEARPDYVSGSGNALDIGSGAVNRATSKVVGPSYKPETTAGKYARTAGEFLPGSLAGPGGLARKAITFGLIPAAASETAGQATEGTAAEPWARVIGGLGGGLTASALFAPRIAPTATQTARQEIADAARRQRVHLPEAAMPDNPTQTWVAGKLGQVPFLGRPLQASAERTASTMGRRAEQIAAQTGDPDYASAAHRSRDALNDWQTDASKTLLEQRYARVDARITDPDRTTPLSSTRAVLRDILDEQDLSTSTASNSAMDLVREATGRRGGLTYEGLRQLRTDIGARLSGKITPEPGTSQPALKRLYGALTDDLEAAVSNSGGQPAVRAWQQANAAAAEVALIRENVAKIVGIKGDASSHAVLNRITKLAGTSNSANIERLGRVMEAIWRTDPDALDDIGAAIIGRLGRDPTQPAAFFSPERYLTGYSKLSPEGRQAIFGGATTQHLDDLARVSQRHRELMRKGNPSGTGGVVVGTGLLTGLFHAMARQSG